MQAQRSPINSSLYEILKLQVCLSSRTLSPGDSWLEIVISYLAGGCGFSQRGLCLSNGFSRISLSEENLFPSSSTFYQRRKAKRVLGDSWVNMWLPLLHNLGLPMECGGVCYNRCSSLKLLTAIVPIINALQTSPDS